jgi:NAD(P)-dependent dehydrogenase (short-subunit alcohol dehydrogenase family)
LNPGLEGKTALVIGASKGIGRAVALALAQEGARVIAVARSRPLLQALNDSHPGILALPLDLMQPGAVQHLVAVVGSVATTDVIYHAMGGSFDAIKAWDRPAAEWAEVWRFNLGIAHDINRAFIPGMVTRKWGRVVHTSSDATKCNSGNVPYTSSKFAVEGYVKTSAKLFARDNVILSCVSPGPTRNDTGWLYRQPADVQQAYMDKYLPINRIAEPEEVAGVVAFLCGEQAGYMAGSVVEVHGGSR